MAEEFDFHGDSQLCPQEAVVAMADSVRERAGEFGFAHWGLCLSRGVGHGSHFLWIGPPIRLIEWSAMMQSTVLRLQTEGYGMDPQEIGKLVAQTVEKVVNMKLAGMRLNSEAASAPPRAKGDEALRELVIREVATLRAELLGAIGQVAQQQHSALVFGLDQLGHRIESWLGHEPAVAPVEAEATGEEPADGPEGASAVEDSSS